MKILVTGTSSGIGLAIAKKFVACGHEVVGLDIRPAVFFDKNYRHIVADVTGELPDIDGVEILINNAGVQNSGRDIEVNLKGAIAVTEKFGMRDGIKSVLFIASASARTGAEFPEYAASKGGVVAYMKNAAMRLAPRGATVNSLSPGGVSTALNNHILESRALWDAVMAETPLKKWATVDEIADWAYFLTVVNKSATAQDILVDNGEADNFNFIW